MQTKSFSFIVQNVRIAEGRAFEEVKYTCRQWHRGHVCTCNVGVSSFYITMEKNNQAKTGIHRITKINNY